MNNSNNPQERPTFRDLKEQDLAEWRDLPQTALLLQDLRQDREHSLHNCSVSAIRGDNAGAAAWAGRADLSTFFIQAIAEKRTEPEPAPTPDSTAPVDPATRRSQRVKLVERQ